MPYRPKPLEKLLLKFGYHKYKIDSEKLIEKLDNGYIYNRKFYTDIDLMLDQVKKELKEYYEE